MPEYLKIIGKIVTDCNDDTRTTSVPPECDWCDNAATSILGGLTLEQEMENWAWQRSFKHKFHTGHCPNLSLPPICLCDNCYAVYKVMCV